jgi:eukaryotic translation initiation factor 2C
VANEQESREEKLTTLEVGMTKLIEEYYQRNRTHPRHIVVYRDGIAHSGFASTCEPEIDKIHRVCREQRMNDVNVVFIVVQKRNNYRLALQNPPHSLHKYTNVPPGTLADNEHANNQIVGSVRLADGNDTPCFLLVSHAALQGTSRVPSYHILCNTGQLSLDRIERLTFDLCHLHFKCTRSISVPAPVFYADRAADKVARACYANNADARSASSGGCAHTLISLIRFCKCACSHSAALLRVSVRSSAAQGTFLLLTAQQSRLLFY